MFDKRSVVVPVRSANPVNVSPMLPFEDQLFLAHNDARAVIEAYIANWTLFRAGSTPVVWSKMR